MDGGQLTFDLMQPDYEKRDDRRFGRRFMLTAVVSSIPVWAGLLIAGWLRLPIFWLIGILCVTLAIPLTVLTIRFRWTECPFCGRRVRVPWNNREFRRGGMLRYTCEQCRVVWSTYLFPGSDV